MGIYTLGQASPTGCIERLRPPTRMIDSDGTGFLSMTSYPSPIRLVRETVSRTREALRWRGRRHPASRTLVFLFFAAFYLAFFAKSLTSGRYIAPSDSLDFGLSAFLSAQSLWTDGMFAGYPIAADPQALTWYPVFRLFHAIGMGWNVFMILPYVLASFGTYLLVQRLSRSTLSGVLAGLTYGFSGALLAHISHFNQVHAACWVPFLFYGLVEIHEGRLNVGALVTSAAVALLVLAGHPQVMVYAVYLAMAYVITRASMHSIPSRARMRQALASAGAVALGFGLSAILLVPARELAAHGSRIEPRWDLFVSKSLPPAQLVTMLLPLSFGGFRTEGSQVDYFGESSPGEMTGYVGVLPLCLALVGIWGLRRPRREALFWVVAALVGLILTVGDATPLAAGAFRLPLYGTFRVPARHFFITSFCLAVAAGLVLADILARRRWMDLHRSAVGGALLTLGAGAMFTWLVPHARGLLIEDGTYRMWAFGWPAVIFLSLISVAWIAARRSLTVTTVGLALIAIHAADMLSVHYVYPGYRLDYGEVVEQRVQLQPSMHRLRDLVHRTGERVLAADGSKNWFLLPNLTRAWEMPAASGTGSMSMERYRELLRMGGPGDVEEQALDRMHRGADLLAIRYALIPEASAIIREGRLDPERWQVVDRLVWPSGSDPSSWVLARNNRAFPRAWLVPETTVLSRRDVLATIASGTLPDGRTFDPASLALLESSPEAPDQNHSSLGASCGTAEVSYRSETSREFLLNASRGCFLVISDVFYPWWRARIDGVPADLVRADYALMGLPVGAGRSRVRIDIVPASVYQGMTISAAAMLMWLTLAFVTVREAGAGAGPAVEPRPDS